MVCELYLNFFNATEREMIVAETRVEEVEVKNWSGSGYILKIKVILFANDQMSDTRKKRIYKQRQGFCLSLRWERL